MERKGGKGAVQGLPGAPCSDAPMLVMQVIPDIEFRP